MSILQCDRHGVALSRHNAWRLLWTKRQQCTRTLKTLFLLYIHGFIVNACVNEQLKLNCFVSSALIHHCLIFFIPIRIGKKWKTSTSPCISFSFYLFCLFTQCHQLLNFSVKIVFQMESSKQILQFSFELIFFFLKDQYDHDSKFDEFFIYTTKMIISHFPLMDYRCKTKNQFFLSFWNLNSLHSTLVYVIFISITSTFPVYMDFGKERVYIQIKSNQIKYVCQSEFNIRICKKKLQKQQQQRKIIKKWKKQMEIDGKLLWSKTEGKQGEIFAQIDLPIEFEAKAM